MPDPSNHVFLLLQGPHGPFFDRLAARLREAGAEVWRVAFNAGDAFFWSDKARLIRHAGPAADWPAHLDRLIGEKRITDLVLYGDTRPVHAAACQAARTRGLRLHVFEEGYLRPYWITYERGGSNGNSALMGIGVDQMRATLSAGGSEPPRPPAHWGDMRPHKFYGALYHFLVLVANDAFPGWSSHRAIAVAQEFRLNLKRLLLTPALAVVSWSRAYRIRLSGCPYVLVPMQLEHDASFRSHSDFASNAQFVETVLRDFARAAPPDQHIVFKAHPLEDGRAGNRQAIRRAAHALGLARRVHYVPGGKLAALMDRAASVVTVNSTAAQQALWRGLPVKALGRAIYAKPGLVSDQSLADFLRDPAPTDRAAYRLFRDYLLQSSQLPGGYYSARARAQALGPVAGLMLAEHDPYTGAAGRSSAARGEDKLLVASQRPSRYSATQKATPRGNHEGTGDNLT